MIGMTERAKRGKRLAAIAALALGVATAGCSTTAKPLKGTLEMSLTSSGGRSCALKRVQVRSSHSDLSVAMPQAIPCLDASRAFLIDDFNFDGIPDVAILAELPADNGPVYDYWLQNRAGKLSPSTSLDDAHLIEPTFNSQTKTITSTAKASATQIVSRTFIWSGTVLRPLSCTVTSLEPRIAPDHGLCSGPP